MKKLDNYSSCLDVLRRADFEIAEENEIYRTGIIWQFNLTLELAWKALQEILKLHGAAGAETGSPREILQLGYKLGSLELFCGLDANEEKAKCFSATIQ